MYNIFQNHFTKNILTTSCEISRVRRNPIGQHWSSVNIGSTSGNGSLLEKKNSILVFAVPCALQYRVTLDRDVTGLDQYTLHNQTLELSGGWGNQNALIINQ